MTRDELVEAFELERCQSSAAQVDLKKLSWMNYEYILQVSDLIFVQQVKQHCNKLVSYTASRNWMWWCPSFGASENVFRNCAAQPVSLYG